MNDLIYRVKKIFKDNFIEDMSAKEFLHFEVRLYLLSKLENNVPINCGWTVFTEYFDTFNDREESEENKSIIFKLRKQDHSYSTSNKWLISQNNYLNIDSKYRLFDIDDFGNLKKQILKYEDNRIAIYDQYIEALCIQKENKIDFAEDNIEYKSNIIKNGVSDYKVYRSDIIDIGGEDIQKLSLYKDKQYIKLDKNKDWHNTLNNMGDKFKSRPNISMQILNNKDDIELKNLIHIVGALGAGKSTYKFAQVFEGVNKHGLKIGIVETSVSNVIDTVKTLRDIGINAIPIIGATTEKDHLLNYLSGMRELNEVQDDDIVKFLSGNCILRAICKDKEESLNYPCNKLYEDGDRVYCPYANKCGHMERVREIESAQVLVTTPHNLVKGSVPGFIDKYNRSLYEIFYDILDMILVDEADGIQSILDDQMMPNIKLNYGDNSLLNKFVELKLELNKSYKSAQNMSSYKLKENISKLERIISGAERVLPKLNTAKNHIINKMWTPTEVFKDISRALRKVESIHNSKFIEFLDEYVSFTDTFNISEDNLTHKLNGLYNKVSDIHNADGYPEESLINEVKYLLEEYNVTIPSRYNKQLFIEKIAFLVILVQMDYVLKIISNDYQYMSYEVYGEIKVTDVFSSVNRRLNHLIKEPCIGTIYGYKISYNNGLNIDVLRYDAVGRSMLELWPRLKESIGLNGPSVICLSGTSFSPGSAHYNIKKSPDILLKGKEEGIIKMKFTPKSDSTKNEYIKISGISNREKRSEKIKLLTKELINDINYQLTKLNGRKVLIVVNSYEDCKVVGEILDFENMNYRLVLNNQDFKNSIPKDNIESFRDTKADICVVPLSIIARGYNILDENQNSYFGSLFFLVRPYMVPGDFSSYIQILHYYLDSICSNVKNKNYIYSEKVSLFRKLCYQSFVNIINMSYWKALSEEEKEIMSWFMIVPIKQAIGRMQRNGNDCNVFFCDVAFSESIRENEVTNKKNSILYSWYETLGECMDNDVIKNLYGNFYEGLESMLSDINYETIEDNDEEWD
ncbi:hypothetical protein [Romboutsia hominis]|uniref:pPIWI_RE_Z domain-containing protein n=1 Tax=Romboutsia hominis TaxID=1507512 RepID=UPI001F06A6FF|nr:hypothetical protein [Romboutsia hominis]MCH1959926.1 hypothetical protein [Romboutsia hominis]MCH1969651.1 hypothetical protein [Romboutsia hominis]